MDFRTASIAGALALTFSTSSFALDLQPYTTKGAADVIFKPADTEFINSAIEACLAG